MPPKNVRTVRQLIYWEYAKLIAGRAVGDSKNWRFVMYTFKKLDGGQMKPSEILRENKLLYKEREGCVYCQDQRADLQWDHLIPKSRGGSETMDNMVPACRTCNASKGALDLFEWYGERRDDIPRLVLGKYLKLIFDYHKQMGTLDDADINADGKLDILDLGAVFPPARRKNAEPPPVQSLSA